MRHFAFDLGSNWDFLDAFLWILAASGLCVFFSLLFVVVSYVSVMFLMYCVLVCKLLGFRVFCECVFQVRVCAPACFCAPVCGGLRA